MKPETTKPETGSIFDQLARSRRSIRGFLPQPVEQGLMEQIFKTAAFAPSNCNTQPWHVSVVSGAARDRLETLLLEQLTSGKKPNPAFFPGDQNLQGVYRSRQIDCAVQYWEVMGVARDDRDARNECAYAFHWHG